MPTFKISSGSHSDSPVRGENMTKVDTIFLLQFWGDNEPYKPATTTLNFFVVRAERHLRGYRGD